MRFFYCVFSFLLIQIAFGQNVTLSGYVEEKASGERLIGATIFEPNSKTGVVTNSYGFFSITLPKETQELQCGFIGFANAIVKLNEIEDFKKPIIIKLEENAQLLEGVVIRAEKSISDRTQMSMVEVPVDNIKQIPALFGEVDVLKALQFLPGVKSGGEGSSGIYVRGGGPDQNLILLDGVPVYNASHLFGFFSVFNADAIKSVRLTKAGFPARFGGRLSSVVEVDLKDGNMSEFHGVASIGLLSSRFTIEGPLVKNKASFLVSARRTYIDLLIYPFIAGGDEIFGYYFQDFNVKANWIINPKNRLYLSLYTGKDDFYSKSKYRYQNTEENQRIGLDWGNITSSIRLNTQFSNTVFGNATLIFSRYNFNIGSEITSKDASTPSNNYFEKFAYLSEIQDFGGKYDIDWNAGKGHFVKFGASLTHHRFQPGAFKIEEATNTNTFDSLIELNSVIKALETNVYIEDEWTVNDRMSLNIGLRFSDYLRFNAFEPRIGACYRLNTTTSIKASYAYMKQYLHLLTNSGLGLPTDLWVSATDKVPPQESQQIAAGLAFDLFDGKFETSFETYYKKMDGIIEYLPGSNFATNRDWENKVATNGKGDAYGFEFFVQKKSGKLNGWVGYTLAFANRQFTNGLINSGKKYPYIYDRRHDLSIVLNYNINSAWKFGGTWVFATGNAYSMPIGAYTVPYYNSNFAELSGSNTVFDYKSKNDARLPNTHRLDVGFTYTKQKQRGEASWNFSAYNAYSRKNPFFVTYDNYSGKSGIYAVSLFPIVPSISWQFTF